MTTKWYYHRKLKSFVGLSPVRRVLISAFNVFVISQNKEHFETKHNYQFAHLGYIAGEYGDAFIGICQHNVNRYIIRKMTAVAFELDGRNRRQLLLPHDEERQIRFRDKRQKYLKIAVCGDNVLVEHTYRLNSPLFKQRTSRVTASWLNLYIMSEEGFVIKLAFVSTLRDIKYGYMDASGQRDIGRGLRNPQFDTEGNLLNFTFNPFGIKLLERQYMYKHTKTFLFDRVRLTSGDHATFLGNGAVGIEVPVCCASYNHGVYQRIPFLLNVYMLDTRPCTSNTSISDYDKMTGRIRLVFQYFDRRYVIFSYERNRLIAWPKGNCLVAKVYLQK
jgi:hypothetical protein